MDYLQTFSREKLGIFFLDLKREKMGHNIISPHEAMNQPLAYQTEPSAPAFEPSSVVQSQQPGLNNYADDQQLLVDIAAPQIGSIKWRASLVESMFSCGTWLKALWFPCMSVASTARDLGLDYDRTFWLTCCCTHAIFATVFHQRELIRQRHGIIGSGCEDFCSMLFCFSCVLAQHSLQTKK